MVYSLCSTCIYEGIPVSSVTMNTILVPGRGRGGRHRFFRVVEEVRWRCLIKSIHLLLLSVRTTKNYESHSMVLCKSRM